MKVLILRSIYFGDEDEPELVKQLVEEYKSRGDTVAVYNMPACDDANHWAGYALTDYSLVCDCMICIDFPTALILHDIKRIIITKPLPENEELQCAVRQAFKESLDYYATRCVDDDTIPIFQNVKEFAALYSGVNK